MAKPKILYDNRLNGTLVASSTASGYNVAYLRDLKPFTWFKAVSLPATVTRDEGSAKSADYALIYGEAGTYEIRASTDNFSASDVLLGTITLTKTAFGLALFTSVSYRYWRVKQTGAGTPPAYSIAMIGVGLEMPRHLTAGFDPVGRMVHSQTNRSEKGHVLGTVTDFEEWSQSLSFRKPLKTWVDDTFQPAWTAHLRDLPFAFAWDTDDYPDVVYWVKAGDKFSAPHIAGPYCSHLEFEVSGRIL